MTDRSLGAYDIADLRDIARRRLPKGVFEFIDRGNGDEVALANNRAAFDRIKLAPHQLVDTSQRTQEITLFGKRHRMPLAIAPTGSAGLTWFEGEIALARAAKAAGIPFTLATGSMTALERVAQEAGGTLWFQVYMWPDRSLSHGLIERAKNHELGIEFLRTGSQDSVAATFGVHAFTVDAARRALEEQERS